MAALTSPRRLCASPHSEFAGVFGRWIYTFSLRSINCGQGLILAYHSSTWIAILPIELTVVPLIGGGRPRPILHLFHGLPTVGDSATLDGSIFPTLPSSASPRGLPAPRCSLTEAIGLATGDRGSAKGARPAAVGSQCNPPFGVRPSQLGRPGDVA